VLSEGFRLRIAVDGVQDKFLRLRDVLHNRKQALDLVNRELFFTGINAIALARLGLAAFVPDIPPFAPALPWPAF